MRHLLQASVRGEYSGISSANLVLIIGAVVYFLMPADLVPDIIVGLGFTDDAAVIAGVVSAVKDELEKFKAWQPTGEEPTEELRAVDSRAESGTRLENQDRSTDNE